MINSEKIKKDLELIQKKGDIHDAISQKRNVKNENYLLKIIEAQAFVFSRILYLFLVSSTKIKNHFTSVEKIKIAQDEIREYLGIPVDIFRVKNKNKNKNLAILYGEYYGNNKDKEILIKQLKKIHEFGNQFGIDEFYLQQRFLYEYLSKNFIEKFQTIYYSEMLDYSCWQIDYLNIKVNQKELSDIILNLENSTIYDLEFLYYLSGKLNDKVVCNAITQFKHNKDVKQLIMIVQNRLLLYLNSETISRNRTFGKVYEMLEVADKYIKSTMFDKGGNYISSNITTLYDYLEVKNYEELLKSIDNQNDNENINILSLLYLYLIEDQTKSNIKYNIDVSFYDYIYDKYKNRKHFKKIPWIRTFKKFKSKILRFLVSIGSIIVFLTLLDLPYYFSDEENAVLSTYEYIVNSIKNVYQKSHAFERDIIDNLSNNIKRIYENIFPSNVQKNIVDYSQSFMENDNDDEKLVAEIKWFSQEKMPVFFSENFSTYGFFANYEPTKFYFADKILQETDFTDARPLFQVKMPMSKASIEYAVAFGNLELPVELFPVGDSYALNQIYIIDNDDPTKVFELNYERVRNRGLIINEEERELLDSISTPMICYIYGLSNSFDESLFQRLTNSRPPNYSRHLSEVKEAVLKGLELDSAASREEINQAIISKDYISNPSYPKMSDEVAYYEKVAALDIIDANLAVTLSVLANDDLYFTVGYKNADNDDKITLDEAYVWTTDEDGNVVDILDSFIPNANVNIMISEVEWSSWLSYQEDESNLNFISEQERKEQELFYNLNITNTEKLKVDNTVGEIFAWIKKNNINHFLGLLIASLIIYHFLGKRIQFGLKLNHTHKILNDPHISETYAQLMDYLYGGINIPIERTEEEMINTIYKEFKALEQDGTIEEIKNEITQTNDKSLKSIYNLLNSITFIIKEKDTLKNEQSRKLVLGGNYGKSR